MKLEAVTKLDNRNSATSKKIDDDVTSANYDAIVIFPIYGQVAAIRKPDPGRIVRRTDIFINTVTFYVTTTELKTLKRVRDIN